MRSSQKPTVTYHLLPAVAGGGSVSFVEGEEGVVVLLSEASALYLRSLHFLQECEYIILYVRTPV